jgi:hypothetical protein
MTYEELRDYIYKYLVSQRIDTDWSKEMSEDMAETIMSELMVD